MVHDGHTGAPVIRPLPEREACFERSIQKSSIVWHSQKSIHPGTQLFKLVVADSRGCSSVVEHLLAKERVESSNLFIRFR